MFKWIVLLVLCLKLFSCATLPPVTDSSTQIPNSVPNKHKIVGGYDARLWQAPWQVALFDDYGSLFCGGTLLSPRVVVTAAHCMLGWSFTVHLGGLDRRELPLQFTVKEIFVHQEYNSSTIDNDIALVILEGHVNIPALKFVDPPSLPVTDDGEDYVDEIVLISGWGKRDHNGSSPKPNKLQAAQVQIFSPDRCKNIYNKLYTDNMICAGVEDYTKDTCQGDSGGPLVFHGKTSNTLLGISSWGIGCAQQGHPGVYTKVSNYVSWIEEKACSSYACFNSTLRLL